MKDTQSFTWDIAYVTEKADGWIKVHFADDCRKYDQKIDCVRHKTRLRRLTSYQMRHWLLRNADKDCRAAMHPSSAEGRPQKFSDGEDYDCAIANKFDAEENQIEGQMQNFEHLVFEVCTFFFKYHEKFCT